MQSLLSLTTHGVPLSVSPISARFPLSKKIEDHDRRREAVQRRLRSHSLTAQGLLAISRFAQNGVVAQVRVASARDLIMGFRDDGDDDVSCTAKAA